MTMPDPVLEAQKIIADNPSVFNDNPLTRTVLIIELWEFSKKMLEWYKGEPVKPLENHKPCK